MSNKKKIYPLILSKKSYINDSEKAPMGNGRYIVVEETRELYYDNDRSERYKLRDIQIVNELSDIESLNPLNRDFFYVISLNQLYYYNGTELSLVNEQKNSGGSSNSRYTEIITGDGINNSFIIEHNMNNIDIIVQVYDVNLMENIYVTVERIDENNIMISFSSIPSTTDKYKVICL